MGVPLTPVVGYVRTASEQDKEGLRPVLDEFAGSAGVILCSLVWDSSEDPGPVRAGFGGCLAMIRAQTARGIVLPTWGHLADTDVVGAALLQAAVRVGASWFVADQSDTPPWALGVATLAIWG